jgi:hypothetical protein
VAFDFGSGRLRQRAVIEAYATLLLLLALVWVVGTATHVLAGVNDMPWVAPVSGLALLLSVSAAAALLPRQGFVNALPVVVVVVGAVAVLVSRAIRPPVAVAAPTLVITLALCSLPFLANWRFGPLGVGLNDDLAPHLAWADALRTGNEALFEQIRAGAYPIGPHVLAAALGTLSLSDALAAFTALLLATQALTAVAALTVLSTQPLGRRVAASVAVGVTYLPIAYFAQGAFKEPLLALLILAFALVLQRAIDDSARRLRYVALLALFGAAAVSSYGYPGTFPLVAAATLAVFLSLFRRRGRLAARSVREVVVAGVVALVVIGVAILPQLERVLSFAPFEASKTPGNLPERISGYAVLGVWRTADFRFVPPETFQAGVLGGAAAIAFLYGVLWWLARGRVAVPATAAATLVVWAVANKTESPYVSAKVLVMAAPTVILITASALIAIDSRAPALSALGKSAVAAVFIAAAVTSSILVLRNAHVGPLDHANELKAIRGLIGDEPTLFLGQDDFAMWELQSPRLSLGWEYTIPSKVPFAVRKSIVDGVPADFDSVDPASLDAFRYVVTVRTSYASSAPTNWKPVRRTRSYMVWRRDGPTRDRHILAEVGAPGALLDCDSRDGRKLSLQRGVAAVRPTPVAASAPWAIDGMPVASESFAFAPLARQAERLIDLPRGEWRVSLQYTSPVPLTIESPGFRTSMPANLDRPGPYWELGKLRGRGATTIAVRPEEPPFDLRTNVVGLGGLVATKSNEGVKMVALAEACGRYVDWYRFSRAR